MKTKGKQFIEKTAQHTFMNDANEFIKVLIVNYQEKDYAIAMTFKEQYAKINVYDAERFNCVSVGGKNYVNKGLRSYIFPGYSKQYSIPTFKAMKELMKDITKLIKDLDPMDKQTIEKITNHLKNANFSKKD